VSIHDDLANVVLFISSRRRAASSKSPEEEKLWRYLRMLCYFTNVTGQVYLFEDSLSGSTPPARPHASVRSSAHRGTFAHLAEELLVKTLAETPEPEHKSVLVLLALLNFVADTGQLKDVEDFFNNELNLAPVVLAYFARYEEAEAWLRSEAQLPSPARLLIGDDYYQFWYMREDQTRGMYRDYVIEPTMEELAAEGIPSQRPSFATRAEAEDWLMKHPANPYLFVAIAGEHYFAVHHPRLHRHSLHHVASALKAWEEHKKTVEREEAQETPG
jgi:hypothetical protein